MKKDVLISVVMPVFNGEKYLHESILSILNQTYKNFEFILIDDGSQDNSHSIIKSFNDSRIKIMSNECNLGVKKTRNKAHEMATGKYVAMFDADDIARPTKLQELFDAMTKDSTIDVCFAKMCLIDSNSKKICDEWYPPLETILKFNNWNFIGYPTVMMKKSMLVSSGGRLDESLSGAGSDTKLWIKLKKENKKFHFINSVHVDYRINPHSVRAPNANKDYWYRVAYACVWNKQKWKSLKYLPKIIKLINKLKLIVHIMLPIIYIHRIIYSKDKHRTLF